MNFGGRWVWLWVPMNPSPQTKLRGGALDRFSNPITVGMKMIRNGDGFTHSPLHVWPSAL